MAAAAAWTPPSASSGVLDAGAMRSRAGSSGPAVPKREFTAAHQAAMDAHTSGLAAPAPAARPTKACRADANAARTAAGWDAPDTGVEADAVGVLPGDVPALGLGDERGAGDLLVGDALGVGTDGVFEQPASASPPTATPPSASRPVRRVNRRFVRGELVTAPSFHAGHGAALIGAATVG